MGLSNLPPGVKISMIPGCRPEDDEWAAAVEQVEQDSTLRWSIPEEREEIERRALDLIEMWHFQDEAALDDAAEVWNEMRRDDAE